MQKHLISFVLGLMLTLSLALPANAANLKFTISGQLAAANPAANEYNANYKVITPEGKIYYLELEKDFYVEWIGEDVYFHVIGTAEKFAVYSGGIGTRNNTAPDLPSTGAPAVMLLLGSMALSGVRLALKRK